MPALLVVDDRPQNLLAIEAILEPLGHELVTAESGPEALRILLHRDDFAAILLDVQMPEMDGFEVAEVIKRRERTSTIPIVFLTALSKEQRHVFRGYEVGAVDYVFKPLDAEILRAKIAVFVELWEKNRQIREQAEQIAAQELAEVRRASAERYRQLADAMPQIVWTSDERGNTTYYNRRWFEYTGMSETDGDTAAAWTRVTHPDDLPSVIAERERTLESGEVFEVEYRFRAADGMYRWHLGRAVPIRTEDGKVDFWIGTATDIDDRKRIEEAQRFLLDAGAVLSTSLDWRAGLQAVAKLAVPRVADWCAIHIAEAERIETLAVHHVDESKVMFARELQERYPPRPGNERGAAAVIASGTAQFIPDIPEDAFAAAAEDETHEALLRQLGLHSFICVPIVARGVAVGAITFVSAESRRRYTETDLRMAEELALRTAAVIENAQLYEEVERRARAARALETIADGVVLIDTEGRVLLWNNAAEQITGIPAADVVGRPAAALPGYKDRVLEVEVDGRPQTVPVEIDGRELWLSFSGVRFDEGTVYAFRDVTEERGLEQMRSDFVATVSHELRTPLAAIYGAAVTLRRPDLTLEEEMRDRLLDIVADESDRLAGIVNDVLLASHLDSGQLQLQIDTIDATKITRAVVDAAQTHLPDGVTLELKTAKSLPAVAADEQQLRQVLVNLVENAVKYSPDGGPVRVEVRRGERGVLWSVADEGLGIPLTERRRIFEKFYRLDPNMTRGIGGTGLGLYICRELVRRLDGRIWVDSNNGKGSKFFVELPAAKRPAHSAEREKTAA